MSTAQFPPICRHGRERFREADVAPSAARGRPEVHRASLERERPHTNGKFTPVPPPAGGGSPLPVSVALAKASPEDRRCVRCERTMKKAGLAVEGGFACGSCAPHYRAPKPCPACSRPTTRLSRGGGLEVPVCDSCRRRATHATCARCRKHRLVAATDADGHKLCGACLPGGESVPLCDGCGSEVPGAGIRRCVRCYNKEVCGTHAARLSEGFRCDWMRELFAAYAKWLWRLRGDKPALHTLLDDHLPFFKTI